MIGGIEESPECPFPENKGASAFVVMAVRDGGYIVHKYNDDYRPECAVEECVLAATTLDEALRYIRKKMLPDELLVPDEDVFRRLREQGLYHQRQTNPFAWSP